jgi:hypothetical protein
MDRMPSFGKRGRHSLPGDLVNSVQVDEKVVIHFKSRAIVGLEFERVLARLGHIELAVVVADGGACGRAEGQGKETRQTAPKRGTQKRGLPDMAAILSQGIVVSFQSRALRTSYVFSAVT